jgi:hypothetical protein
MKQPYPDFRRKRTFYLWVKKNHKKAIQSLEKRIIEHQTKIKAELLKENLDAGLIKLEDKYTIILLSSYD